MLQTVLNPNIMLKLFRVTLVLLMVGSAGLTQAQSDEPVFRYKQEIEEIAKNINQKSPEPVRTAVHEPEVAVQRAPLTASDETNIYNRIQKMEWDVQAAGNNRSAGLDTDYRNLRQEYRIYAEDQGVSNLDQESLALYLRYLKMDDKSAYDQYQSSAD